MKTQLLQQNLFYGLLAIGLFLAWPALSLAEPGELDPTFGNDAMLSGVAEFQFPNSRVRTKPKIKIHAKRADKDSETSQYHQQTMSKLNFSFSPSFSLGLPALHKAENRFNGFHRSKQTALYWRILENR